MSRKSLALIIAAAGAVMLCVQGCSGQSSSAVCAAQEVEASPATVKPGATVVVTGRRFVDGCDDQGQGEKTVPLRDQPVTWTQDGASVTLTRVDADAEGTIRAEIRVPENAATGPASITVGQAMKLSLVVAAS